MREVSSAFKTRVLVVEDEEFTLNLLRDVLESAGFEVEISTSVPRAISMIDTFDPHAVVTDLNFGRSAPSGAELLHHIEENHPWIGKIVLTSHTSPVLAVEDARPIPNTVTYLVKSELGAIADLITAVEESISRTTQSTVLPRDEGDRIVISAVQGEILRLLAEGYTNAAIAKHRGTSLRAAETLIQRTFSSLGIKSDENVNPRVLAVRLWQDGKVTIK